jgi:hypothetical protein
MLHAANSRLNLAAAARYVNKAEPAKSPLLLNAVTAHGGLARPPLKDFTVPAYRHLEQWVGMLTADSKADTVPVKKPSIPDPALPRDEFDPALFNRQSKRP